MSKSPLLDLIENSKGVADEVIDTVKSVSKSAPEVVDSAKKAVDPEELKDIMLTLVKNVSGGDGPEVSRLISILRTTEGKNALSRLVKLERSSIESFYDGLNLAGDFNIENATKAIIEINKRTATVGSIRSAIQRVGLSSTGSTNKSYRELITLGRNLYKKKLETFKLVIAATESDPSIITEEFLKEANGRMFRKMYNESGIASKLTSQNDSMFKHEVPGVKPPKLETPSPKIRKVDAPSSKATEIDAPSQKATEVDAPSSKATEVDAPSQKATEVEAPSQKATEVEAPSQKATEVDAPSSKATEVEAPSSKATEVEAPSQKATEVDATSSKATEVDATSQKATEVDESIEAAENLKKTYSEMEDDLIRQKAELLSQNAKLRSEATEAQLKRVSDLESEIDRLSTLVDKVPENVVTKDSAENLSSLLSNLIKSETVKSATGLIGLPRLLLSGVTTGIAAKTAISVGGGWYLYKLYSSIENRPEILAAFEEFSSGVSEIISDTDVEYREGTKSEAALNRIRDYITMYESTLNSLGPDSDKKDFDYINKLQKRIITDIFILRNNEDDLVSGDLDDLLMRLSVSTKRLDLFLISKEDQVKKISGGKSLKKKPIVPEPVVPEPVVPEPVVPEVPGVGTIDLSGLNAEARNLAPIAINLLNTNLGLAFVDPDEIWGGFITKTGNKSTDYLQNIKFLIENDILNRRKLRKFIRTKVKGFRPNSGFRKALKHYRLQGLFGGNKSKKMASLKLAHLSANSINESSISMSKMANSFENKYYSDALKGLSDECTSAYYAEFKSLYNGSHGASEKNDYKSLYESQGESIISKIKDAHPQSISLLDSRGDGGVIENTFEQHQKSRDIANSIPTGNFRTRYASVASELTKLASSARSNGQYDVSLLIEEALCSLIINK